MSPPSAVARSSSATRVDNVCFLSSDVLLLTGTTTHTSDEPDRVTLVATPQMTVLEHEALVLDRRSDVDELTWLVLAAIPAAQVDAARAASVLVGTPRSTLAVAPDLGSAAAGIQPLLRDLVSAVEDARRPEILAWLCGYAARSATADPAPLAASLHAAREVLRERLPRCELRPDARHGLSVDHVFAADHETFYVKGWARDALGRPARMTAVSPEGVRTEFGPTVFRHARDDVAEFYGSSASPEEEALYGFITTIELSAPSSTDEGWIVEVVGADGAGVEAAAPPVERDIAVARSLMLHDAGYELPGEDALRATHLAPALMRLQDRWHAAIGAARVDDYGPQPASPAATIIVPLFRRLEFLEHQLAQFVHDDEFGSYELVYVLDSPDDERWLRQLASALFPLYRVPFRTVVMSHNGGFAAANNVGAAAARGDKLVLLNSDVLPGRPGWLGRMIRFYDETPDIGALGVKLLYEDDSLQHAGLHFDRATDDDVWGNEHLFKGMHRSFPPANVVRTVPAVTAACMMVDRRLYEAVGGLSTAYLQGDYEDSDLCLRLARGGKQTWYLPSVELYHLEGQSYPSVMRLETSQYNRWLHTHLWRAEIEEVAAAWRAVPAPATTASPATPRRKRSSGGPAEGERQGVQP